MATIDTIAELGTAAGVFDAIIDLLGAVVSSFNQKEFPTVTIQRLGAIKQVIRENTRVLRGSGIEQQLRDAVIDLEGIISDYERKIAVFGKDFVGARNAFKAPIRAKFIPLLVPEEEGMPSPATVWARSFEKLSRILG